MNDAGSSEVVTDSSLWCGSRRDCDQMGWQRWGACLGSRSVLRTGRSRYLVPTRNCKSRYGQVAGSRR
jgi:hypothetical protein